MHTKISVIIPCYNQAAYLPKAVASIKAQTFTDWECLIIDDGSTDNSADIARNLANNDKRIYMLQKENGGSASARDMGLQHAKGEYIQFLDADDTIAPEKFEKQVTLMDRKELDLSNTASCFENNNEKRTSSSAIKLNLYKILTQWGLGASIPIHGFLYRTEFIRWNNLTFKNECRYREDWRWHIICFSVHPKYGIIPDYCGAIYFQNENGKTGSYIRMQEGNFEFMAYILPQLKGIRKLLWIFRISEELWMWLLRMFKYRSTKIAKTILLLPKTAIIIAIILMPLSVWWILVYYIKTYLTK